MSRYFGVGKCAMIYEDSGANIGCPTIITWTCVPPTLQVILTFIGSGRYVCTCLHESSPIN
jgi:hypothetical protein